MLDNEDINLEELTAKTLNENIDLGCFDCSVDDPLELNEFIHKEALQYQKESMGITYLFYYNDLIVGYVTIAMGAIEVKETRLPRRSREKDYPALLLGRLGVHNDYRHRNIGRSICSWTIGLANEFSKKLGCKFVVLLTAQNKVSFYTKCGFEKCPKYDNKQKVLMYFQIC